MREHRLKERALTAAQDERADAVGVRLGIRKSSTDACKRRCQCQSVVLRIQKVRYSQGRTPATAKDVPCRNLARWLSKMGTMIPVLWHRRRARRHSSWYPLTSNCSRKRSMSATRSHVVLFSRHAVLGGAKCCRGQEPGRGSIACARHREMQFTDSRRRFTRSTLVKGVDAVVLWVEPSL